MRDSMVPGVFSSRAANSIALIFRAGDGAPSLVGPDVAGRRRLWGTRTVRRVLLLARAHASDLHGPLSDVWRWSPRPLLARGLRRIPWAVHGALCIRGVRRMASVERRAGRRADDPCAPADRGRVLVWLCGFVPAAHRGRPYRVARRRMVGPALNRPRRTSPCGADRTHASGACQ